MSPVSLKPGDFKTALKIFSAKVDVCRKLTQCVPQRLTNWFKKTFFFLSFLYFFQMNSFSFYEFLHYFAFVILFSN